MAKKFVSWNVNGLRACIKKGFYDFLADAAPDVLCIQECRANPDQVELDLPGYRVFWNPAEKKGYSGTIVLSREDPLHASFGMGNPKHDNEGRIITLEYPHHYL
ncbi:MAG: endonuclease/exonuclease/phosphatase family protein, partial [SAR324 cluster bacterium]|nr:endonuclease/exonuclease/phosphatase family protein [SAR324 cluster bacterium]